MTYTVKQLSTLAGVSVRTLHYYDEIDLLKPSWLGDNNYRQYEEAEVLRLQQILFFRELGFSLKEIKEIIDGQDFDLMTMLQAHRTGLQARVNRLQSLIQTIDSTLLYITGDMNMNEKQLFTGFDEEEEKRYMEEARRRWDEAEVSASYKRWNNYSKQEKENIKLEGQAIYTELAALADGDPGSPEVQKIIGRWHQHLRHFYEPSLERLRGLGQLYVDDPEFARNFRALDPKLPEFMQKAIEIYCQDLD